MAQGLNNDQLRRIYFESSTGSKSFRKRKDHIRTNESKQSFFDSNINHKRLSEKEISRFENFFDTYVYPTSQNYIFKEPKIISTPSLVNQNIPEVSESFAEHTLLEDMTDQHLEPDLQFESEVEVFDLGVEMPQLEEDLSKEIKFAEEAQDEIPVDDDLIYLENLMGSCINKDVTPDANSLSDIFAEIVGNEKESISNYESSVFDANIQMLFAEEAEVTLGPSSPTEIEDSKFALKTPFVPEPEIPKVTIELPPAPPVPEIVEQPLVVSVVDADADVDAKDMVEEVSEEFVAAHVEDFIPDKKKKKNSKLRMLDMILILIILVILGALAYHFRDLLPFDLPF